MYENFEYYTPTKVIFGKDTELRVPEMIRQFGGHKVLLHYGGYSAVRSGLLDCIKKSLEEQGIAYVELGGVVPNPHIEKVYEGIDLCKKEGVDFLLAVGGGSVIDSCKAISIGLTNEGDVWDYYEKHLKVKDALPIGSVLTIAAAGSEMSSGSVITNEKNGLKRDCGSELLRPKFAIMNPELTMTLPDYQTASGAVDILMHTMERYFNICDNYEITDSISEALMRTVIKYARILVKEPRNYKARAELMWAGSLSHNGLTECGTNCGDWATHNMEHEMGGMFDVAHGAGLAAIWGSWARYVHKAAPHRFVQFAVNVFHVTPGFDDEETIEKGIQAVENFYRELHMPTNMRELGIAPTDEQIAFMAASAEKKTGGTNGVIIPLKAADMEKIYRAAR